MFHNFSKILFKQRKLSQVGRSENILYKSNRKGGLFLGKMWWKILANNDRFPDRLYELSQQESIKFGFFVDR